jgi:hypothetical protein
VTARGRTTSRLAAAAVAAVAASSPGVSGASAEVGRAADLTDLVLGGPAAEGLRAGGVKVGAVAPADRAGKRLTLPVSGGALKPVRLDHEGGLLLRAQGRRLQLRALRISIGKRAKVTARAGKRRFAIFTLAGRPRVDAATRTVEIGGARLLLTRGGAKLLGRRLGVDGLRPGAFARLRSRAVFPAPPPAEPPFKPGDLGPPPPVMERPVSAEDVSEITIVWHPRDSWLRYVAASGAPPEGTTATGGAAPGPVTNASDCPDRAVGPTPLAYSFTFTPAAGSWHDDASGAAAIYGTGAVHFRYSSRGIDMTLAAPEVELAGEDSRLIFTFSGSGDSAIPTQRAVLTDLVTDGTPSSTAPAPGGGEELSYDLVRGDLAAAGAAAFGAYPAGDDFGCVSVGFTTAP